MVRGEGLGKLLQTPVKTLDPRRFDEIIPTPLTSQSTHLRDWGTRIAACAGTQKTFKH